MKICVVTSLAELAPLAAQWDRLTRGVPFRSWPWLSTWWEHYGSSDHRRTSVELFVVCVEDQGELVAVAPWYVETFPLHGRVLQFLGSGPVCSEYQSVLCKPGWETKVAARLARWLCEQAEPGAAGKAAWDQIELEGIDSTDEMMRRLTEQLSLHGALVHCRPGLPCWRVELPDSWDEYLQSLSKSHRKELRGFRRRLFDSGKAVLHTARHPLELERGWRLLMDLHQRRRQSLGDPGCFAAPRFASFHGQVTERLLASGHLRLHWLEVEGKPVAAEYHLAGDNGVIYAYQSGIEIDALGLAPGRLVTLAILRRAIGEGYRSFDLLRGDEPYKAHWRAKPRPTVELCVLPGKGADRLRFGMWLAGRSMKDWLRSRPKITPAWLPTSSERPWFEPATAGQPCWQPTKDSLGD